ncbi:MAG: hypothetical protein LBN00_08490 [Oscillospiraceae bacterium]|jgi:hypothetical protein|nr:hypothetical protein [Oscillospiraceae bacterium]
MPNNEKKLYQDILKEIGENKAKITELEEELTRRKRESRPARPDNPLYDERQLLIRGKVYRRTLRFIWWLFIIYIIMQSRGWVLTVRPNAQMGVFALIGLAFYYVDMLKHDAYFYSKKNSVVVQLLGFILVIPLVAARLIIDIVRDKIAVEPLIIDGKLTSFALLIILLAVVLGIVVYAMIKYKRWKKAEMEEHDDEEDT